MNIYKFVKVMIRVYVSVQENLLCLMPPPSQAYLLMSHEHYLFLASVWKLFHKHVNELIKDIIIHQEWLKTY